MSDRPMDRVPEATPAEGGSAARQLPAEIVGLPGQLDAIGAAMTEIRIQLAGLRKVDDRIDHIEELLTALARQLTEDASPGVLGTVVQRLDELPMTLTRLLDGMNEDVRHAAAEAANTVGVAAAEASIAAAEAAGEAILTDQDAKLAGLAEAITSIESSLGRRATEAIELRSAVGELSPMIESVGRSVEELADVVQELAGVVGGVRPAMDRSDDAARLITATNEELSIRIAGLSSTLEAIAGHVDRPALTTAAAGATAADLQAVLEEATDHIATEVAVAGQQAVHALQAAGQGLTSSALASFERATMSAQSDVERATDAALETLLAAVDARLAAGVDAVREALDAPRGEVATPAHAPVDVTDLARTASDAAVTAALDATHAVADRLVEQIAGQLEEATTDALRAAIEEAVGEAIEASVGPALHAAERAIADSAAAISAAATEATAADVQAATAATTNAVERATESIEDSLRQALAVREIHVERPSDGPGITTAMMSAVAESLDQFSARVQTDLDLMGERLTALAKVLETLVEDTTSRRRGAPGSALDLLRQVAAESPAPPKARRRTPRRT